MIHGRTASLLLLLASTTVAFLFAEVVVRGFFPAWAPRTAQVTRFWQYDARYGWAHIPGSTGVFQSYGIRAHVVINSRGFRGPVVPYTRVAGTRRVLVLGDSFVWGFGVETDEMFTTRLTRALPGVEIVNLGVSGYSTDQELLLYGDQGRKYQPDLVVLVVAVNDLPGNARTVESVVYGKPAFVMDVGGTLRLINQPVPKTPWLKRVTIQMTWRSYILTRLNRYFYERQVAAAAVPERRTPFPHFGMEKITARLLVEFKRAVEADGADLLVVLVDGFGPDGRAMAEFLAKSDIECLSLDHFLNASDPSQHLPDGFHWSPAGHALVTQALLTNLKNKIDSMTSASSASADVGVAER